MKQKRLSVWLSGALLAGAAVWLLWRAETFSAGQRWLSRLYTQEGMVGQEAQTVPWLTVVAIFSAALAGAWLGVDGKRHPSHVWTVLAVAVLWCLTSVTLAFSGIAFEPFSALVSLTLAGLVGWVGGSALENEATSDVAALIGSRAQPSTIARLASTGYLHDQARWSEGVVLVAHVTGSAPTARGEEEAEAEVRAIQALTDEMQEQLAQEEGALLDWSMPCTVRVFIGIGSERGLNELAQTGAEVGRRLMEACREFQRLSVQADRPRLSVVMALAAGPLRLGRHGPSGTSSFTASGPIADLALQLAGATIASTPSGGGVAAEPLGDSLPIRLSRRMAEFLRPHYHLGMASGGSWQELGGLRAQEDVSTGPDEAELMPFAE